MPFEIVRNDIVKMQVDAIVNTANPKPIIGWGCDAGIHKKAGPQLLEARRKIGALELGEVAVTPGFELDAKYVFHAVGPVWQGGEQGEVQALRRCYDEALRLAVEYHCESIAFPLLSAGNHGVPKPIALQTAINAFSSFLMEHELHIYLVVFSKDAFALSEKLFRSVDSYIDEHYILDKTLDEYGVKDKCSVRGAEVAQITRELNLRRNLRRKAQLSGQQASPMAEARQAPPCYSAAAAPGDLEMLLKQTDAGFSETLLKLIDRSGKTDAEVYKRANVDRKLFSKIRNNPAYKPTKATALAFALALELNLAETKDLIGRAGHALSHSSKFDIIVEFFIQQGNYNVFELNEVLFYYDQPLIGA